ncbi:MAG TPA: AMP-binding protein [Candidatus Kryptonia bacterium]|nr:AMP-binding protein [Candidatus Kryptonia bacterium]
MSFAPWVWNIPEHFNIGTACTDAHLDTAIAERVAVVVDDDRVGGRQLTFRELAERTSRFAQLLRDLGVGASERVLIRLPNCIEYPVVFLGALKRGAIPVPTSPMLTQEEIEYLLRDSGAVVLVTDPASWNAMHAALDRVAQIGHVILTGDAEKSPASSRISTVNLEAALAEIPRWEPPHPTRAEDPAYLVYTSGTTGYPKGVLHAQRALLGRQPSSEYWFDFRPEGDRVLHSGKYNWTYVLGTGLMDPLYRGHTAIVHEGSSDASRWPPLIAKHRATIFIGVPTLYRHIIQRTEFGRADVPTLRHCMCAGEALTDEVLAAWRERFGLEIYEGLGMTECSYYLCQTKSRPIRPGSAGFAQPGHDVKLLDPVTWREVAPDEEGMLCVPRNDPDLMLRYWNQPEETAALFHGEWFLTGDYARRDADGYIWFLGRKDDLINSFGYRVSPYEVERVFAEHPEVAEVAAVGEEVEHGKVLVVAYVVRRPGTSITADGLIEYGRQHLALYKAPKIVYLVDALPRTRNGKVLRRALKPPAAAM